MSSPHTGIKVCFDLKAHQRDSPQCANMHKRSCPYPVIVHTCAHACTQTHTRTHSLINIASLFCVIPLSGERPVSTDSIALLDQQFLSPPLSFCLSLSLHTHLAHISAACAASDLLAELPIISKHLARNHKHPDQSHLGSFSINYPVSRMLDYGEKAGEWGLLHLIAYHRDFQ